MGGRTKLTAAALALNTAKNLAAAYHTIDADDVANGMALAAPRPERLIIHVKNAAKETKATLTTALTGDNNDLKYTSKLNGALGNAITVEYVDPDDVDAELAVSVDGTAITVSLATGAAKAITTTASDIATAIAAHAEANALVAVANAGSDTGAGTVTEMAATALTGGKGANRLTVKAGVYSRATLGDLVVEIPAESEMFIGPLESMRFEQADETLYLDIADATTITIGAGLLPVGV